MLMFEVTDKANEMIREFLKDKDEKAAIRLIVAGGG
jgi:Fe-S cluster assembly iron-binding protein IscA